MGCSKAALHSLPLATLYLSERCNSRCISCDYWRHGRENMSLAAVARWLPGFKALGTKVVLISGGEPLLNPEWVEIVQMLKSQGLRLWLLTSGLSLAKHSQQVDALFESVTVSLDGACAETYADIRGLDAFDTVCNGIRAAAQRLPVGVRVTLQRANYRELPRLVLLARECGASSISFLAADVGNPHVFGREGVDGIASDIALQASDLPVLEAVLARMEQEQAADFRSGFIKESPNKLRRIHAYYSAVCGLGAFPPTRCNAPEFSAVIEASGGVRPCFFIPGTGAQAGGDLPRALNDVLMKRLRAGIREGRRNECASCVCSMWRDPMEVW